MAFAAMSLPFQPRNLQALILIIFYINLLCFQHIRAASNDTDYLALLKFKESITGDPKEILSSWNSSNHMRPQASTSHRVEPERLSSQWNHIIPRWQSLFLEKCLPRRQQFLWRNPTRVWTFVQIKRTLYGEQQIKRRDSMELDKLH
ncbi:hypothetical protein K1719_020997 [Acacia pycnantha]|nr:hypothetical protein K1719_020997 [Acacia pycnantha]